MTFEIIPSSCSPNCTMQKWNVQGVPHIIIVAGKLKQTRPLSALRARDRMMEC